MSLYDKTFLGDSFQDFLDVACFQSMLLVWKGATM